MKKTISKMFESRSIVGYQIIGNLSNHQNILEELNHDINTVKSWHWNDWSFQVFNCEGNPYVKLLVFTKD